MLACVAKLRFEYTSITIDSGLTNIVRRGLIVHRDPDDLKFNPYEMQIQGSHAQLLLNAKALIFLN